MICPHTRAQLPRYSSHIATSQGLPSRGEAWAIDGPARGLAPAQWQWPSRPIFFISDAHADAAAFDASLLISGGVQWVHNDLQLTREGREGLFVIGGDCLDKGPSNLALLRRVRRLMALGASVKLLAGNHDMRLLMGLRALALPASPLTDHLFVRMGAKAVPLLREVFDSYLSGAPLPAWVPDANECRRRLLPAERWFREFPRAAAGLMPPLAIDKEVKRLREKRDTFEDACALAGLDIRAVYATAHHCLQLFCEPEGEFHWFFRDMELVHQEGAFLFLHAGLDDTLASVLARKGSACLNRLYRHQSHHQPFEFYYGALANALRTKYRKVDRPLSEAGVRRAWQQGIRAVVHGHRNRLQGQQLTLRQGLLHVEGDVTLDRNSRRKEGLSGIGAGVTIIRPQGQLIGISRDYPYAKVFSADSIAHVRSPRNHAAP